MEPDRAEVKRPARRLADRLPPGSMFGHFRILGVLGRGGMGTVFRAADLDRGGEEVALKLLLMSKVRDARDEDRFHREAETAASLQHPNIGTVYAIGEEAGQLYLSMPLYDGQTLDRRLDRAAELEPMPIDEVASIAAQLASALAAAHKAGVVHRDIKPANLMLLGGRRLKLLDFGLALRVGAPSLTDHGSAVGTMVYMAPEQIRGEAGGPQADLWSFGAVVYEMLAGRPPFGRSGAQTMQWLMLAIVEQEPAPLRELRPDVPPALAAVVERCLAKDPAARFASAADIVAALRESGLVRDPPPRPRRRLLHSLAAAAAVFLLALGAAFLFRPPADPLRVAILAPEVEGQVSGAARDQIAGNLQKAMFQALQALPRLRVVDPATAEEVVSARAYCGERLCQVVLERRRRADGSDLWTSTFEAPVGAFDAVPTDLTRRLRGTYAAHP